MNSNIIFETFYSAIKQSFFEKSYHFSENSLVTALEEDDFFDETAISHTKIMLSSWSEFLAELLKHKNIGNLTGHLLNHIHFLKFTPVENRTFHLHKFTEIFLALFEFIVFNGIIYHENAEFEEDMKEIELGLSHFQPDIKPAQLTFYYLSRNADEINEVTEKYIVQVLESLVLNKSKSFHQSLNNLKTIQETITTALQMDHAEETDPLILKLKKEFNIINQFYIILKEFVEFRDSAGLSKFQFEVRTTFDYPFLDALKNISKWYSESDHQYLDLANSSLEIITAKKPFRRADILLSETLRSIYDLSLEYENTESDEFGKLFEIILQVISDPEIIFPLKKIAVHFLDDVAGYPHLIAQNLVPHLNTILKQCSEDDISVLYRKKLFKYAMIIIKNLGQKRFFTINQIKKYIKIIQLIDKKLQNQTMIKLGEFKRIKYRLPDIYLLNELERGFASQLLYALEDFVDWDEGKEMIGQLRDSSIKTLPRVNVMDKLMMVATEISDYRDYSEDVPASAFIKSEIIRNLMEKIIVESFTHFDEVIKHFYATVLMHLLNLAFDNEMISSKQREELYKLLRTKYKTVTQNLPLTLMKFKETDIFGEGYEKEFTSIINLWQVYLPIYRVYTLEKVNQI